MLGPSLESHGGMASCASTLLNGGLDRRCNVRYLATTEEGCKARKLACGLSTLFVFSREAKDCDLVHIHFSYGVSMTRKALFVRRAKNMGKKVILHSHSSAMERAILEGDSGSKNEIKKFLSLADALIVLSSKWKDLICDELDIKRSIVHVIPNGVPLGDPSAKPDHDERSCCNILFLGRLEEEKGVGTLIEATGALVRNGAVIELVLAGSGSDEETQRYQLLARREGVNCSFVGWVDSERRGICWSRPTCLPFLQSERFFPYPFSKPWEPASLRSLPIADPSQKSYTTDETGCFANRGIPNRSAHAWLCSCRTLCCARGSQYRDSKP